MMLRKTDYGGMILSIAFYMLFMCLMQSLTALGLPELQRPFIWKDAKVRDLFDSMMRGYPIGYLMLWEFIWYLDGSKEIGL